MVGERIDVKEGGAAVARNATRNMPNHYDCFGTCVVREVGDVNIFQLEPATFIGKVVFITPILKLNVKTFAPRELVRIRVVFEVDSVEVIGDICQGDLTTRRGRQKEEWYDKKDKEFHSENLLVANVAHERLAHATTKEAVHGESAPSGYLAAAFG